MTIFLHGSFLCVWGSQVFTLCVFLGLPTLLSQFAFLIKLLQLGSTGCQPLLPGSPLLLLPSLPGSFNSLRDLRVHKLLSHWHFFFFIFKRLLSESTSLWGLLPKEKHFSVSMTQMYPLPRALHPAMRKIPSCQLSPFPILTLTNPLSVRSYCYLLQYLHFLSDNPTAWHQLQFSLASGSAVHISKELRNSSTCHSQQCLGGLLRTAMSHPLAQQNEPTHVSSNYLVFRRRVPAIDLPWRLLWILHFPDWSGQTNWVAPVFSFLQGVFDICTVCRAHRQLPLPSGIPAVPVIKKPEDLLLHLQLASKSTCRLAHQAAMTTDCNRNKGSKQKHQSKQ